MFLHVVLAVLRFSTLRVSALGLSALVVAFAMAGCSEDLPTAIAPATGTVTLDFSHDVAGAVLVLQDSVYSNAAGESYNVVRMNYLISNVELVPANGPHVLIPGPFFIDAFADSTLCPVLVSIPPGTYEQVRFTFGLDEAMNVSNTYVNEAWHGKMSWPDLLGGGYHYMILDGFVDPGQPTERNYNTHLGRTQTEPHSFRVTLDVAPFAIDGNQVDVAVQVDVNQWYEAPNVYSFPDPAFIMDRPDVQQVLQDNGGTVFSVP
jgi:hypothetical protein